MAMQLKDIEALALAIHNTESTVAFGGSFSICRQGVPLGRTPHDLDIFVISATRKSIEAITSVLKARGFHVGSGSSSSSHSNAIAIYENSDGFKVEIYEASPGTIYVDDKVLGTETDHWLHMPIQLVGLYDTIKWKLTYIDEGNEKQAYKCLMDIQAITSHVYNSRKVNQC